MPWWYYLISLVIGLIVWFIWKKPCLGILVGYSFLILVETILIRESFYGEHIKLEPFWSWRVFETQRDQIMANIIMFIPVGLISGWLWKWRGILLGVGLSVMIEVLQLMSRRGLCEFDDVMHNSLGTAIGIGIVVLLNHMLIKEEYK